MRHIAILVLLLAGCGGTDQLGNHPGTTTLAPPAPTAADPSQLFVANLVETLSNSSYVDSILEDPNPFLETGLLMCEVLEGGAQPSEVLDQFLSAFGPAPGDDDSALAGALLGSAVNAFCPDFRDVLVEDLG